MRVILSIKAGKILPSTLLRKLGNYNRKNRLFQVFQELGRVIRTIYLLEYISSLPFRQQITGSTNKVEKYHQFTGWISFGGENLLAYDSEERDKRIKYVDLLANAVMVQNVVDITRYLKELKGEGIVFTKEDVASLSPYLTRGSKRFGEYVLDLDNKPEPLSEESLELEV
jgi:TnpA family transposase